MTLLASREVRVTVKLCWKPQRRTSHCCTSGILHGKQEQKSVMKDGCKNACMQGHAQKATSLACVPFQRYLLCREERCAPLLMCHTAWSSVSEYAPFSQDTLNKGLASLDKKQRLFLDQSRGSAFNRPQTHQLW